MSERDLDKRVSRYLTRHGAYWIKTHGGQYGRTGISDFLVCHRGQFIAIEDKTAKGKVTPMQAYEQDRVRLAGGRAIIARSVDDVIECIVDVDRYLDARRAA